MEIIIACLVCLVIGVMVATVWNKSRAAQPQAVQSASPTEPKPANAVQPVEEAVLPERIVVADGDQEVMSLSIVKDTANALSQLQGAKKLGQQGLVKALRSIVEPLAKMAPATATAVQANNSQLMEVVINGNMLAAADGDGLRAIALAPKGFEHARLYQPEKLQNIANAAAAWQIASVIVAQKHLADISATLKRVESKVDSIQAFLEEDRLAVIISARNYLEVTKQAIDNGEFLERTRNQLEQFDVELDRAGLTLISQIERENALALEKDNVGCEGEFESARKKQTKISRLIEELSICNEVRLANWYLCSLYPDSSKVLGARLDQIKTRVDSTGVIHKNLNETLTNDLLEINASFTSDNTIKLRRDEVKKIAWDGHEKLQLGIRNCAQIVRQIDSVRSDRMSSNRILVETQNGTPTSVYLCQ